jgi:hypothetical protein
MTIPPPQSGQVIRYAYLWWNKAHAGREDGSKNRPCGIVLTRITSAGRTVAYVLPITHTPSANDEDGEEIPLATKQRLGLDGEKSWVITTELNRFTWPGPDIRPTAAGNHLYGYLPEKLMKRVLESVRRNARSKRLKPAPQTE